MTLPDLHSPTSHALRSEPSHTLTSQLVPALYEELAEAITVVDAAIVARDAEAKARALETATAIVFDLIASVDFRRGGELAPRLAALYSYFASELSYLARSDDRQQIRGLLDMIGVLTGTWRDGGVKKRL